jgi:polar amino acid transport system substrate-binding protein
MIKKTLLLMLICAGLALAFYGNTPKQTDANTLIVGTNAEFPPFTFRNDTRIIGFDIDIINEVAKRLGKTVQFKDMPFDALIPELTLGYVDVLAAGMSSTEERAKRVSFTKPYIKSDPLVILTMVHPKSPQSMDVGDLFGKTVVVNEGYTADLFLSSKPEVDLIRLATPADAFLALKNGRAYAFVTAQSTVNSFLATQNQTFMTYVIKDAMETCSLVIAKNNPELLSAVQSALDGMEQDGTLAQLKSRWMLQ